MLRRSRSMEGPAPAALVALVAVLAMATGCVSPPDPVVVDGAQRTRWIEDVLNAFDPDDPFQGWCMFRDSSEVVVDGSCCRRWVGEPPPHRIGELTRDDLVRAVIDRTTAKGNPALAIIETGPIEGAPNDVVGVHCEDISGHAELRAYRMRQDPASEASPRRFQLLGIRRSPPFLFLADSPDVVLPLPNWSAFAEAAE